MFVGSTIEAETAGRNPCSTAFLRKTLMSLRGREKCLHSEPHDWIVMVHSIIGAPGQRVVLVRDIIYRDRAAPADHL